MSDNFVKITKEFVIKEQKGFRSRVKMWKCLAPAELNAVEFIQETINPAGDVDGTSTYNFFLTDDEVRTLAAGLLK